MMRLHALILALTIAVLTGCAAVGVPATNDPDAKLAQAGTLFGDLNRPLPAERLIQEAIDIYKARNDRAKLAFAYGEYGHFLSSPSVDRWAHIYSEHGFIDQTVTLSNRYDRAADYFIQSRKMYEELQRPDMVSSMYLNEAKAHNLGENLDQVCLATKQSLRWHLIAKEIQPGEKYSFPEGYSSFEDFLRAAHLSFGCASEDLDGVTAEGS